MKTNNTLIAYFFSFPKGVMKIYPKPYCWHIPQALRHLNIKQGDMVEVIANNKKTHILVSKVFREEIEDTGKYYKPVTKRLRKS